MNWYVAKLVYQVITGGGSHTPQFDEQLRLIRADELDWAWEKAQVLGRLGEFSFFNQQRQEVHWKFIDVVDVCMVQQIDDGVEIYSTTEEPENAQEYIELIHARARRVFLSRNEPKSQMATHAF